MTRTQLKLMAALAALVLLVVLVFGVLAERGLRALELERIERSLEARALLVRDLVGEIPVDQEHAGELDTIADRAARASEKLAGSIVQRDARVRRVLFGDQRPELVDDLFENRHATRRASLIQKE